MTETDRIEREKFFLDLWQGRTYEEWLADHDRKTANDAETFLMEQRSS